MSKGCATCGVQLGAMDGVFDGGDWYCNFNHRDDGAFRKAMQRQRDENAANARKEKAELDARPIPPHLDGFLNQTLKSWPYPRELAPLPVTNCYHCGNPFVTDTSHIRNTNPERSFCGSACAAIDAAGLQECGCPVVGGHTLLCPGERLFLPLVPIHEASKNLPPGDYDGAYVGGKLLLTPKGESRTLQVASGVPKPKTRVLRVEKKDVRVEDISCAPCGAKAPPLEKHTLAGTDITPANTHGWAKLTYPFVMRDVSLPSLQSEITYVCPKCAPSVAKHIHYLSQHPEARKP